MKKKFLQLLLLFPVLIAGSSCLAQQVKTKPTQSIVKLIIDGVLTISSGDHKLLVYQFNTVYPPKGIDTNHKRSGFIHPLSTPHGQVLTRIQPPDHTGSPFVTKEK